ncbi:hypothetical protein DPMN_115024 [Dreissena polymorpha]|uniref:Uncharacterized protein n=1 Tax=Dreissena polymorpha TaxID=45954 RepID=A0A9D4KLP9_DREPO|nr:hypothetical protein DPMN_115024 [Dreissena polymorpha]
MIESKYCLPCSDSRKQIQASMKRVLKANTGYHALGLKAITGYLLVRLLDLKAIQVTIGQGLEENTGFDAINRGSKYRPTCNEGWKQKMKMLL